MDQMSETLTAPARKPAHRKPALRKPRGQGASRRGEILDAAKRLFIQEGFATATMRRIASEVGVSPTALYLHFADKEAILQAIADDYFSELLVKLQFSQNSEGPPLTRLREGLRAYLEFGLGRVDEYRLTFQSRAIRANAAAGADDVADMSFAVLEHAVEELVGGGVFRAGDTVTIAETIWCCLHGLTSALIDLTDHVCSDRNALIESVLDTVVTGLACPEVAGACSADA